MISIGCTRAWYILTCINEHVISACKMPFLPSLAISTVFATFWLAVFSYPPNLAICHFLPLLQHSHHFCNISTCCILVPFQSCNMLSPLSHSAFPTCLLLLQIIPFQAAHCPVLILQDVIPTFSCYISAAFTKIPLTISLDHHNLVIYMYCSCSPTLIATCLLLLQTILLWASHSSVHLATFLAPLL